MIIMQLDLSSSVLKILRFCWSGVLILNWRSCFGSCRGHYWIPTITCWIEHHAGKHEQDLPDRFPNLCAHILLHIIVKA